MKRFDPRIVLGILLILGGGLALAQTMGYLQNATDYFWAGVFILGGLAFISLLFSDNWWAAFPGFTLLALGALILLPKSLDELGGALFLGGIAISFWYVYFTDRAGRWWAIIPGGVLTALSMLIFASTYFEEYSGAIVLGGIGLTFFVVYLTSPQERWWALIPGGVLATLAGMTIAAERFGEFQTAGFFFLGLALTFLLVAILAGMKWAYWPALGHFVQAVQRHVDVARILHEPGLGDLELDRMVRHAVLAHRGVDVLEQVGALEQPVRQVHRDRVGKAEAVLPDARLARRLADRPLAQRHDQPGLLGERDELAGRHEDAVALPAHQRLDADHAHAAGVDLGLVVQDELVALDRLVQRALELDLGAPLSGQARAVQRVRVRPLRLGRVHRHVGAAHQVDDRAAVARKQRDAHARRDEALLTADEDRVLHQVENARCHPLGVVLLADLGQQRDELVAAVAADAFERAMRARTDRVDRDLDLLVRVAHARAQPAPHLHQHLVAGGPSKASPRAVRAGS